MQSTAKFYTVEEAADKLHLSTHMVRRMLREGTLPGFKPGKRTWLVPVEEFDKWVTKKTSDAKSNADNSAKESSDPASVAPPTQQEEELL